MRRHVAGGARIAVVPPGSTDTRGLFEDDEIQVARREQFDAHADPARTRAYDDDTMALHRLQAWRCWVRIVHGSSLTTSRPRMQAWETK